MERERGTETMSSADVTCYIDPDGPCSNPSPSSDSGIECRNCGWLMIEHVRVVKSYATSTESVLSRRDVNNRYIGEATECLPTKYVHVFFAGQQRCQCDERERGIDE